MDYNFLVGMFEKDAIDYCNDNLLHYDLVYTNDKKTKGNTKIVIAVRATVEKITLVIGRFLLSVEEGIEIE